MSVCRSKEVFSCFHLSSKDELENLSDFLGEGYIISPLIYPTGNESSKQFNIQTTGAISRKYTVNLGDWVVTWALGIKDIYSDFVFKENFEIIKIRKKRG